MLAVTPVGGCVTAILAGMTRSDEISRAVRQALAQLPTLLEHAGVEIAEERVDYDVRLGRLVVRRRRDGAMFSLGELDPRDVAEATGGIVAFCCLPRGRAEEWTVFVDGRAIHRERLIVPAPVRSAVLKGVPA